MTLNDFLGLYLNVGMLDSLHIVVLHNDGMETTTYDICSCCYKEVMRALSETYGDLIVESFINFTECETMLINLKGESDNDKAK